MRLGFLRRLGMGAGTWGLASRGLGCLGAGIPGSDDFGSCRLA